MALTLAFAKRYGVLLDETHSAESITVEYHMHPKLTVLLELRRALAKPLLLKQISEAAFQEKLLTQYDAHTSNSIHLAKDLGESLDLHRLVEALPQTEDLLDSRDDAPIIRLLNALFNEAIKENASDIHIEPFETQIIIRFRVDGILHEILSLQRILAPLVLSRIKVMAKLDIAEKRLPQDGRILLHIGHHTIDVRVSVIPTNHGERAVLRLLDQRNTPLDLTALGMDDTTQKAVQQIIAKPHGILLVTGPTGSGKTTTLYAILTLLNNKKRNILTVEDPVEYDLEGIGKTQVNPKIDMTFAKGLRAMLRQDPDVVMVGEIRDLETAQIAIQASLTGHLVLSTLHTNSAIGAMTRLIDMGAEPFLIASSLSGILAERLVRLLCPHCKAPRAPSPAEMQMLELTPYGTYTLYYPKGCEQCKQSGYLGRSGIYEFITIDETLRKMIHERASEQALQHYARLASKSLQQDGFRRVLAGETTLEEILRVTG